MPVKKTPPLPAPALKDAKASTGTDHARGSGSSAEGNDPSLAHGTSRMREVPAKKK